MCFLMNLWIICIVFNFVRYFVLWRRILIDILGELAKRYIRSDILWFDLLIFVDVLWLFEISFVFRKLVEYVV